MRRECATVAGFPRCFCIHTVLFFDSGAMKLPDVYSDWRIAGGLALLILGASNWIVGLRETRQSSQVIAQTAHSIPGSDYRSFDELEAGAGAVLEPFTAQTKSLSYARARMDFYHVTFLSGQVLVIAGLLLTLAG